LQIFTTSSSLLMDIPGIPSVFERIGWFIWKDQLGSNFRYKPEVEYPLRISEITFYFSLPFLPNSSIFAPDLKKHHFSMLMRYHTILKFSVFSVFLAAFAGLLVGFSQEAHSMSHGEEAQ